MSGRTFLEDEEGGRYEQRENKPEEAPDLPSEGFALAMRHRPAICEKTSPGSISSFRLRITHPGRTALSAPPAGACVLPGRRDVLSCDILRTSLRCRGPA